MGDPRDVEDPMFPTGVAEEPAIPSLEALDPGALEEIAPLIQGALGTVPQDLGLADGGFSQAPPDVVDPQGGMSTPDNLSLPDGSTDEGGMLRVAELPATDIQGDVPPPAPIPPTSQELANAGREARLAHEADAGRGGVGVGADSTAEQLGLMTMEGRTVRFTGGAPSERSQRAIARDMLLEQLSGKGVVSPRTSEALRQATMAAEQSRTAAALAEAQGQFDVAASLEELGNQQLAEAADFQEAAQLAQEETDEQMGKLQDIITGIRETNIDPNRLFNTGPASNRFAAAIAIAAGAISQANNPGTQNTALQIVNAAVDRDLRAQVADIQRQGLAANQQRGLLGVLRQTMLDDRAAFEAYRALRLQQARTMLEAQGRRIGGGQGLLNFQAAEAEMDRAGLAAMAAAEENAFQWRLTRNRPITRGNAQSLVDHALGRPPRARSGGSGRGRRRAQPTGNPGLGSDAPVFQTHAEALLEQQRRMESGRRSFIGELPNGGGFRVVDEGQFEEVTIEELNRVQGQVGFSVPALGINATADQATRLRNLLGEKFQETVLTLANMGAIDEAIRELSQIEIDVGTAWGTDDRARAEATLAILKPVIGGALGLGALAEADLELLDQALANPLEVDAPNAIARVLSGARVLRNVATAPLSLVGIDASGAGRGTEELGREAQDR